MATQGPNVKKLIIRKMSTDAIPDGGGLEDGMRFLSDPQGISRAAKAATEWVSIAIRAVREATDPNPWRDASDEDIAGEILRKIEERKPPWQRSV